MTTKGKETEGKRNSLKGDEQVKKRQDLAGKQRCLGWDVEGGREMTDRELEEVWRLAETAPVMR